MISDERSKRNLIGVRPELVRLAEHLPGGFVFKGVPYFAVVTDGMRTLAEQEEFVRTGASETLNSRHLTGHAIDISLFRKDTGEYQEGMPVYAAYSKIVFAEAKQLGIKLTWGGSWTSPKDGYHYQLTWKDYPPEGMKPKTVSNSKTIAASIAGMGVTVLPEIVAQATDATESMASFLKDEWRVWIQIALIFVFGYVALERKRNAERNGT